MFSIARLAKVLALLAVSGGWAGGATAESSPAMVERLQHYHGCIVEQLPLTLGDIAVADEAVLAQVTSACEGALEPLGSWLLEESGSELFTAVELTKVRKNAQAEMLRAIMIRLQQT